ncbi:uncharacterized protein EAF01_004286 [Botrytis porri]|uniref:Uncharacterized protein n=1 Tax=Botrytis porri TaxID=87229 RepID=A0A4Z1KTT0_9HELO|nr:uncharacterized protein EAF01_004286 [Botrytis porri]KAF7908531.1 hypothetical protein EAF01_004286 [Botrytis porri]TGO87922.1 hypothetical protein BPOR_0195g00080 [Botrytis porri]
MRDRSNASYHPAAFQAPNLQDKKPFSFPLNYTGEPAPNIEGARENGRPGDASDRKDDANKKKVSKTSDADTRGSSRDEDGTNRIDDAYNKEAPKTSGTHTHRSSRNDDVGAPNKPAKKAKKKTEEEGGNSVDKKNGSRFGGALSDLRSKVKRR